MVLVVGGLAYKAVVNLLNSLPVVPICEQLI